MIEQVLPGLTRIGLIGVNAYLVDAGGDGLVLVDTGGPMHPRVILRAISSAGRRPTDVGDILLTHQHIDHAGGAADLRKATGARVCIHALDAPELSAGDPARPAHGHNLRTRLVAPTSRWMRLRPTSIDHELVDGEAIGGALGMTVIHTPGHTAGHTSFLWPAHGGVLFVGDALSNWSGRLGFAPLAEDWDEAKASMRGLAELDFEVAVFGHGRVMTGGAVSRVRAFVESAAA